MYRLNQISGLDWQNKLVELFCASDFEELTTYFITFGEYRLESGISIEMPILPYWPPDYVPRRPKTWATTQTSVIRQILLENYYDVLQTELHIRPEEIFGIERSASIAANVDDVVVEKFSFCYNTDYGSVKIFEFELKGA